MNRTRLSKGQEPEEITNQETDIPITDNVMDRKRKNRKGQHARNKSNEKYRLKQNQKTQASIDKMIEDTKEKLRINVEKAFGSRIPPGIVKPVIEVKPQTWTLATICDQVITVLETAGKIRFDAPLDRVSARRSLQVISAAQLEAKIFFSRRLAPHRKTWEYNQEYSQKMHHYSTAFPRNFTPIVTYIDQFGKFTLNGQEFIPWAPENDIEYMNNFCTYRSMVKMATTPERVEGFNHLEFLLPQVGHNPPPDAIREIENSCGPNGLPMYMVLLDRQMAIDAHIMNNDNVFIPAVVPGFYMPGVIEYREAIPTALPLEIDFDANVEAFATLQARVARKFKLAWPELDMQSGRGTAIQLVASTPESHGFRRAWSTREVGTDVLALGAIFNVAPSRPDRDYSIYDPDIAHVEAEVQVKNAISTYVDTIHGDFVSG